MPEYKSLYWDPNNIEFVSPELPSGYEPTPNPVGFISDIVQREDFKFNTFNFIVSGCGTGKSYFMNHTILDLFPEYDADDVLILTSRKIIAEQQASEEGSCRLLSNGRAVDQYRYTIAKRYGEECTYYIDGGKIEVATTTCFANLLNNHRFIDSKKIIVFDECHSLIVDEFMSCNSLIRNWLMWTWDKTERMFIGLTATLSGVNKWAASFMPIHFVLSAPLIRYKAQNVICTDYYTLEVLLKRLSGRTLILCNSLKKCKELRRKLVNSYHVVSQHNPACTNNMRNLIDKMIVDRAVPVGYKVPNTVHNADGSYGYTIAPIDTLIVTSMMREGFNIEEYSGIENVVCCSIDPVDIIQFSGRCRHNVRNLIIAPLFLSKSGKYVDEYEQFIATGESNEWSDQLVPITAIAPRQWTRYNGGLYNQRCYTRKAIIPEKKMHPVEVELYKYVVPEHAKTSKCCSNTQLMKIVQMAKEMKYPYGTATNVTAKTVTDYFCKRFVVTMDTVACGRKKMYTFTMPPHATDVLQNRQAECLCDTDAIIFMRGVNMAGSKQKDWKILHQADLDEIRAVALTEDLLPLNPSYYTTDRILKRFCDLYGCTIKNIPAAGKARAAGIALIDLYGKKIQ